MPVGFPVELIREIGVHPGRSMLNGGWDTTSQSGSESPWIDGHD